MALLSLRNGKSVPIFTGAKFVLFTRPVNRSLLGLLNALFVRHTPRDSLITLTRFVPTNQFSYLSSSPTPSISPSPVFVGRQRRRFGVWVCRHPWRSRPRLVFVGGRAEKRFRSRGRRHRGTRPRRRRSRQIHRSVDGVAGDRLGRDTVPQGASRSQTSARWRCRIEREVRSRKRTSGGRKGSCLGGRDCFFFLQEFLEA